MIHIVYFYCHKKAGGVMTMSNNNKRYLNNRNHKCSCKILMIQLPKGREMAVAFNKFYRIHNKFCLKVACVVVVMNGFKMGNQP